MASYECKSCGNLYTNDQAKCAYCGTPTINPQGKSSQTISRPISVNITPPNVNKEQIKMNASNINVCLLIFLFVVFWPGAVIYLILKLTSKE